MKYHSFAKNLQSEKFEARKQSRIEFEVLQVDFAENYSLESQDEIQSGHWSHEGVSLFRV